MSPRIVYEDPELLVINKPAGLLTHPKHSSDQSPSVVGWLLEKYPSIAKVGDPEKLRNGARDPLRPGIVHRLDKETSGLLIIAKTQMAFDHLKKQFQERKIKKTYLALVYGKLKNKSGVIDAPLGKLGIRQSTKIHGKKELAEKEAITEYQVITEYQDYSLLEVKPQTGRTNQIRVHLKAIGHPVVCDPVYAGRKAVCPPELGRLFLHAQKLSFTTPTGQALTLEADPPPELENFLRGLPKANI
ncbi:MAG: RluA family pseudouridine synthase [Patescibacteria group bacterium]